MSPTKPKVLVVDDEHILASTFSVILQQAGFDAVPAYSGEEAIQVAAALAPDVLLSDVAMGGMNGVDAAIRILETNPNCKVLFVSGHVSTMDVLTQAQERGFNFTALQKPVSPPELIGRITQILAPASN